LTLLVWLLLATAAFATLPVGAQDEELSIRLHRDFGYGGFAGDIQGRFSFTASGPDDLENVTYTIDGEPMGTVSEAPFRLRFEFDDI